MQLKGRSHRGMSSDASAFCSLIGQFRGICGIDGPWRATLVSPAHPTRAARKQGSTKARNARVRRWTIQMAWRFQLSRKKVLWPNGIGREPEDLAENAKQYSCRLKRPFLSRGLPDQSTIHRLVSSSVDNSRLRGALPNCDICSAVKL